MTSFPLGAAAGALTVDTLVRERARLFPDRRALAEEGRSISYRELVRRVDRLCHGLHRSGVRHGDRIALLSENRIEYVEVFLAAAALGAIVACQNWRQSDAELDHCVRLAEPAILIVSPRHADRVVVNAGIAPRVLTIGADYEKLITSAGDAPFDSRSSPEDILLIVYTSGTTGYPKGAAISHRAEMGRATIAMADSQLFAGRGTISWSPMFHIGGADPTLATLMNGDTTFIVDGFKPGVMLEIMSRELLGNVTLMPAAIGRFIDEAHRTGLRPKGLRICGAMPDLVPRHQIAEITTLLNAGFRNTFGSTETGGPPASRHVIPVGVIPEKLSKVQSSYTRIRLVDEDDRDVPDGTPGEVLFRGPSLFSGYWNAPEVNAHEFRGGWFHMGDMLLRNPDGTLDFVDRRKYMIKSGGENIYPAEIERVLLEDRRIAEAAIVRRPDPRWGEVPVAFVVKADDALTADDVLALCRGRIASYKLPKDILFIQEKDVPRSETDKVKRHELEKRLLAPSA